MMYPTQNEMIRVFTKHYNGMPWLLRKFVPSFFMLLLRRSDLSFTSLNNALYYYEPLLVLSLKPVRELYALLYNPKRALVDFQYALDPELLEQISNTLDQIEEQHTRGFAIQIVICYLQSVASSVLDTNTLHDLLTYLLDKSDDHLHHLHDVLEWYQQSSNLLAQPAANNNWRKLLQIRPNLLSSDFHRISDFFLHKTTLLQDTQAQANFDAIMHIAQRSTHLLPEITRMCEEDQVSCLFEGESAQAHFDFLIHHQRASDMAKILLKVHQLACSTLLCIPLLENRERYWADSICKSLDSLAYLGFFDDRKRDDYVQILLGNNLRDYDIEAILDFLRRFKENTVLQQHKDSLLSLIVEHPRPYGTVGSFQELERRQLLRIETFILACYARYTHDPFAQAINPAIIDAFIFLKHKTSLFENFSENYTQQCAVLQKMAQAPQHVYLYDREGDAYLNKVLSILASAQLLPCLTLNNIITIIDKIACDMVCFKAILDCLHKKQKLNIDTFNRYIGSSLQQFDIHRDMYSRKYQFEFTRNHHVLYAQLFNTPARIAYFSDALLWCLLPCTVKTVMINDIVSESVLPPEVVIQIVSQLSAPINSLDMSHYGLGGIPRDDLRAFFTAIPPHIKTLNIAWCSLQDIPLALLQDLAGNCGHIEKLYLNAIELNVMSVEARRALLAIFPQVTIIYFTDGHHRLMHDNDPMARFRFTRQLGLSVAVPSLQALSTFFAKKQNIESADPYENTLLNRTC